MANALFYLGWLGLLTGGLIHVGLAVVTLLGLGPYGGALEPRLEPSHRPALRIFSRHIALHILIMGVSWLALAIWGVRQGLLWAWTTLLVIGLLHFAAFAWTENQREERWTPPDWRWWTVLLLFLVSAVLAAPANLPP